MNTIPLNVLISAHKALAAVINVEHFSTIKGLSGDEYVEIIQARASLGYYIEKLTSAQQVEVQS